MSKIKYIYEKNIFEMIYEDTDKIENILEKYMEIVKKVIHYIDFDAPHGWQDPDSYEADCVKGDIADMFKEANKEQIFEIYKIVNKNWDLRRI